jgi:hypothetical protein
MLVRRFAGMMVAAALLTGSVVAALADPPQTSGAPTEDAVKAFALRWYAQMQKGDLDRSQLNAAYSAQLTDDAVRAMAHNVNLYGAPPTSAQILHTRKIADQTFYLVKLIYPRGDAASLLIGFDAQGKITGLSFVSMAGD